EELALRHISLHLWVISGSPLDRAISAQVDGVERSGTNRIGCEIWRLAISVLPVSQNVRSERAAHAACLKTLRTFCSASGRTKIVGGEFCRTTTSTASGTATPVRFGCSKT